MCIRLIVQRQFSANSTKHVHMRPFSGPKVKWATPGIFHCAYWLPSAFVASYYFVKLQIVSGRSMQPTLNPESSLWRDVGLFDRFAIHSKMDFRRDDIVTLHSPEDRGRVLVKRIIALAGDQVKTLPPYPDPEVVVPQGHAWVEGDEPFHSDDSNRFGPVPLALIESRLIAVVWPPPRFGYLFRGDNDGISKPKRNSVRYRTAMAELDRQRWRNNRVTPDQDCGK
ncbi:hypothetical protein D9757_000133 [Collybiopsis confluens]|uniref:Mitochondrial inner membrane protease subunit 2 n=1 Tax=Collybiopsis confluens TaxID=2823264 RepID=A0A8H5I1Y2_9AGAR|nr:hypothetical protein D9757_000133 [Collybiopsis confluens]